MNRFVRFSFLLALVFIQFQVMGQCPATLPSPCTSPACKVAVSGTSVTVNAGEVLYVTSDYTSGTITLNGGAVNVLTGVTLNLDARVADNANGAINNCGTLTNTSAYNPNVNTTINNYSSGASYTLNQSSGFNFNNYADNVTLSIIGNSNNTVKILNDRSKSLTVSSSNPIGNSTASLVDNAGTITWTSTFNNFQNGAKILNRQEAIFNATNTASSGNLNLQIENRGTMNVAANGVNMNSGFVDNQLYGIINFTSGEFRLNGGVNVNNRGSISVYDFYNNSGGKVNLFGNSVFNITHAINTINDAFTSNGCATVNLVGPGTLEYSGSNDRVTSDPDVNFCGKAPYQSSAESNPVTNVSNTNPMILTMSRNQNGKVINGGKIYILGVGGNSAAIGYWTVNNLSCPTGNNNPCTLELVGGNGIASGAYTGGGTVFTDPRLGAANYLGYDNCINPCPPLNVTFVSVKVVKDGEYAKVLWATSSEKNSAYFVIERSYEGGDFEPIGVVDAAGNSSSLISYSFVDTDLFRDGIYYYRIKEVDLNNQFDYSGIDSFKKSGNSSVSIIQKGSTLLVDNNESPSTHVFLYTVDGKLLFEKYVDSQHVEVDLSFIQSSAMYIVKVATSVDVHCEKILK